MTSGLFITFEGIEGSGKSTQLRLLADHITKRGRNVVCTREPGGTRTGDRVRAILLDPELAEMDPATEMLLFASSRAQHVRELLRPSLDQGDVVLCDRYLHSSLAYQAWARGLGRDRVMSANAAAIDGLLPDLILLLDLDVARAFDRAEARGRLDRIELAGRGFHQAVRAGFHKERDLDPARFVTIDADRPPDEVFASVLAAVGGRLDGPE
ncbi:MAG: dTMP kinase [Deltaproteobacteria bacterium]|nr:dTMP kinase [Deltaproteobacteria bacterium]